MDNKHNCETLLSIYDEDLNRLAQRIGKDRSLSTLKTMQQSRKYVADYLKEQTDQTDLPLDKVTPQLIHDFSVWLSAVRQLRGGTVWLVCQQLKGVVTRAHQRGKIMWNPFGGFHIAKKIRPRQYLTEEELGKLMAHRFNSDSLSFARDIFVFSAFTGLSFIDIRELRLSDIMDIKGAAWIISKRHKTKVPYQVRLLDLPLKILRHYLSKERERVFGPMEYRTMAYRIQKVMEEVGIAKHVTMHCARHSFAVLAINKGVPIETVSRILGHTNITTTQIYAKITIDKICSDMVNFEDKLCDLISNNNINQSTEDS
jgi:integrase